MLTDEKAVSYYLKNDSFVNDVYSILAKYIIDMYEKTNHVSGIDLVLSYLVVMILKIKN